MVDIQQNALRAFKQYPCACLAHLVQPLPHWLRIFENEWRNFLKVSNQAGTVYGRFAKTGAQRIMVRAQTVQLRIKRIQMRKIAHANGAAADLIFISRANTAASRTDLARTGGGFAQAIQITMDG